MGRLASVMRRPRMPGEFSRHLVGPPNYEPSGLVPGWKRGRRLTHTGEEACGASKVAGPVPGNTMTTAYVCVAALGES
jgi:hypothetical protein